MAVCLAFPWEEGGGEEKLRGTWIWLNGGFFGGNRYRGLMGVGGMRVEK